MKQQLGPPEGAAEEDEGPVRREEYGGDARSGERRVDAQEAMDKTDEEGAPSKKSQRVASNPSGDSARAGQSAQPPV